MQIRRLLPGVFIGVYMLTLSVVSYHAADISNSGESGTSKVELNVSGSRFKVTVPTVLPIDVDEDNNVTVATDAEIINYCQGRVRVTDAFVEGMNDWSLVDFNTDFKKIPVDTKQYGMIINGAKVAANGTFALSGFDVIEGGATYPVTYNGNVAIQSSPWNHYQIGKVVFTVAWDTVNTYYSSLALAVADANHLTTENADLNTTENAVAALSISGDSACITLLNNSLDTPSLIIDVDADINLNGNQVVFTDTAGITYNSNLSIYNGALSGRAQGSFIKQGTSDSSLSFSISDTTVNVDLDGNAASPLVSVFLPTNSVFVADNLTVNANIINDKSSHVNAIAYKNADTQSEITNCTFRLISEQPVASRIWGLMLGGNTTFSDNTIEYEINEYSGSQCYGLVKTQGTLNLLNSKIVMNLSAPNTANSTIYGVYHAPSASGAESVLFCQNNDIHINCNLLSEVTDASNRISLSALRVTRAEISSVSDRFSVTTDTIYNNVISPNVVYIGYSPCAEFDNVYVYATAKPSYNPDASGMGTGMRIVSSKATLTKNNGENYVHGSHSGISASGADTHLYIYGGTYESPAHGGLYFTGSNGSTLETYHSSFLNTQYYGEVFDDTVLDRQGAYYVADFGCTANIDDCFIAGGKFGFRVKYYQNLNADGVDKNTVHHADATIKNSYIYGDYVAIHDDLYPGMGTLTVGENVTLEWGGMSPLDDIPYDIWAWRGADVVDNRH